MARQSTIRGGGMHGGLFNSIVYGDASKLPRLINRLVLIGRECMGETA